MRRGRVFFILAFILILGLAAVALVYYRFILPGQQTQVQMTVVVTEPPKTIYVAKEYLEAGTILSEDNIEELPWPGADITTSMFEQEEKSDLIGRVLKFAVDEKKPILDTMLLVQEEVLPMNPSPWSFSVEKPSVAVSIPVSRLSSVSFAPRSGDYVDVIVTLLLVDVDTEFQSILPNMTGVVIASGPPDPESKEQNPLTVDITSLTQEGLPDETGMKLPSMPISPGVFGRVVIDPVLGQAIYVVPSEKQRPRLVSQMIIRKALVMRLGDFPLTPPTPVAQQSALPADQQVQVQGQPTASPPPPEKPVSITLIVSPQDAVTLNYLMFSGAQITLALRHPKDLSTEIFSPVTLQYLLENYQIPVPIRLPYGIQPRVDDLVLPTPVPQATAKP